MFIRVLRALFLKEGLNRGGTAEAAPSSSWTEAFSVPGP